MKMSYFQYSDRSYLGHFASPVADTLIQLTKPVRKELLGFNYGFRCSCATCRGD